MSALGSTVATIFSIGMIGVAVGVPICFLAKNWRRFLTGASVVATGTIFILLTLLILAAGGMREAFGRDDGRYAQSPLKSWFDSLRSGKGPCCSDADGSAVSDVDWESNGSRYRVRIEGQWWDVPEDAVVTEPNRYGRTMVWPIFYRSLGSTVRIEIRCFMPGSMS